MKCYPNKKKVFLKGEFHLIDWSATDLISDKGGVVVSPFQMFSGKGGVGRQMSDFGWQGGEGRVCKPQSLVGLEGNL